MSHSHPNFDRFLLNTNQRIVLSEKWSTGTCFETKFLHTAIMALSSISCFGDISRLKWLYIFFSSFFWNIDVLFSRTINRFSSLQWLFSGTGTFVFASFDKQIYVHIFVVYIEWKKGRKSIEASNFERPQKRMKTQTLALGLLATNCWDWDIRAFFSSHIQHCNAYILNSIVQSFQTYTWCDTFMLRFKLFNRLKWWHFST